jgi:uncharacterized membrane protein YphA (DoxX/SURF4 family)
MLGDLTKNPRMSLEADAKSWRWAAIVRSLALLLLVAAYLQGGINKAIYLTAAAAEMQHFGLEPAIPLALATIFLELGASALILTGWMRWLGALVLATFTLAATFLANQFWSVPSPGRFAVENAFFEHLGLVGGLVFVAWTDWRDNATRRKS